MVGHPGNPHDQSAASRVSLPDVLRGGPPYRRLRSAEGAGAGGLVRARERTAPGADCRGRLWRRWPAGALQRRVGYEDWRHTGKWLLPAERAAMAGAKLSPRGGAMEWGGGGRSWFFVSPPAGGGCRS